jgi:hypothetical protein
MNVVNLTEAMEPRMDADISVSVFLGIKFIAKHEGVFN